MLGLVAACVWWCFEWNDVDVTAVLLLPPVVLLHTVCPLPASTPLPQAVCELLSIAGAELEKSAKGKARLEAAFRQLERLAGASRVYAARIRFVVRDVLELRAQHWVARRETFTVRGRRRAEQGEGRLMNTFVQPGGSEHCLPPGKDCKRLGSVLTPPPSYFAGQEAGRHPQRGAGGAGHRGCAHPGAGGAARGAATPGCQAARGGGALPRWAAAGQGRQAGDGWR